MCVTCKPGLRIDWAPGHHTLSGPPFNFNLKIIVSLHINDLIILYNFDYTKNIQGVSYVSVQGCFFNNYGSMIWNFIKKKDVFLYF